MRKIKPVQERAVKVAEDNAKDSNSHKRKKQKSSGGCNSKKILNV